MPVNMSNPDTEPAENCSLEPNSAPRSTRRTFLKRAGFGAALVGIGAAAGNSILSATAKDGPTQAIVLAEIKNRDIGESVDVIYAFKKLGHSFWNRSSEPAAEIQQPHDL